MFSTRGGVLWFVFLNREPTSVEWPSLSPVVSLADRAPSLASKAEPESVMTLFVINRFVWFISKFCPSLGAGIPSLCMKNPVNEKSNNKPWSWRTECCKINIVLWTSQLFWGKLPASWVLHWKVTLKGSSTWKKWGPPIFCVAANGHARWQAAIEDSWN